MTFQQMWGSLHKLISSSLSGQNYLFQGKEKIFSQLAKESHNLKVGLEATLAIMIQKQCEK